VCYLLFIFSQTGRRAAHHNFKNELNQKYKRYYTLKAIRVAWNITLIDWDIDVQLYRGEEILWFIEIDPNAISSYL
jgi:hypothetical protein